jgi:hypothetical protein
VSWTQCSSFVAKAAGMVSFSGDPAVVWMVHAVLSESLFQC